ncbi:MAG: mannonate dehydratase [Chitinophagaceae bacterium]
MAAMQSSMRWFSPVDPVNLDYIKQAGAVAVVTALHQIPHGEVWPLEEIQKRKEIIQSKNLEWNVVESVTVHEDIKTRSGNYLQYIENYKQTLRNISACGIKIVTYNFMPVNDWTRTNLDYEMPDGSKALYFNWVDVAVFDIYILKRKNAEKNYNKNILSEAEKRYKQCSKKQLNNLAKTILFGIPGEKKLSINEMRKMLKKYKEIDHAALRENLKYFVQQIVAVAEEQNIKLAIHPDDPPFDIFGLPRIFRNADDLNFILKSVDTINNGICFCTGSLGAAAGNDLIEMIRTIDKRLHFVHLRNTKRDEYGNFFEDNHLDGDTDMFSVVKEILKIQQQIEEPMPFRPDHGHQMMDDLNKKTNPGYSCIGRMRGLAELRGLMLGIYKSEGW